MEPVNTSTPSWLVGLLIVFAIATAATFGLLLYRHAEYASLLEQYNALSDLNKQLEPEVSEMSRVPPDLEGEIRARREKISSLIDNERTTQQDVDHLVSHDADTVRAIGEQRESELSKYRNKLKEMTDRTKELGSEEEHQYASERENDERRKDLRHEVENLSEVIAEKEKDARRSNTELDARIDELEARVRQLTEEQDLAKREFKPAGQIVASVAADGFVVINRGHRQNLRNGTKFIVFNRRAGKNVAKGVIQVIEVDNDIATARVIVENDRNDPLIVGDLLHNPIYDPEKVNHFAIRGDFLRYSKEELATFIKDSGDIVDPDITIATDYLVAGSNAPAALAQATKLGVSILSEDQLLDFITIQPHHEAVTAITEVRHAAASGKTFALVGSFTVADKGAIERYIEHNGGKTTGSVHDGVDVVIAGDGAESAIAEAHRHGIPVIDQGQFTHLDASFSQAK